MKQLNDLINTINKRYSVRNYKNKIIEKEKLQQLQEYLDSNKKGPLGSNLRFQIVNGSDYNKDELKKFGTYGLIKGPRIFIAGAVNRNTYGMEDFGYCMEKIILKSTSLGLGTCWLGGSLNRTTFAEKLNISDNEIIPAVTPIGYAEKRNTIRGNIISLIIKSKKRKNPEEIFFENDSNHPLDLDKCKDFALVLESVRMAPSAGNMQPWRIIKENDIFHFYLKESDAFNNKKRYGDAKLQNIDMGIAMAHFELAAAELELYGKWQISEPVLNKGDLKYIVSWINHVKEN